MGYEDGLTWPFRLDKLLISVIVFILLLIFTTFPVFIVLYSSENIWQFLLSILLLLISVSDYAIIQALVTSKPPASISYWVGRRYHPVYYFCIDSIVAVLYFSIGLIGAGYTGVSMTNMDWFYATFEIFGLIFMSLTFVLPGSIYEEGIKIADTDNPVAAANPLAPAAYDPANRSINTLGKKASAANPLASAANPLARSANPLASAANVAAHRSINTLGNEAANADDADDAAKKKKKEALIKARSIQTLGMEPRQWYDTRQSVSTQALPRIDTRALLRIDTLQVFDLPGSTSWKLNLILFYFGYALEVAEIITYFALLPKDAKVDTWWKIYILVALISSFLSLVFFSGQSLSQGPSNAQAQLLSQMFSLFMIIMAVIVLSLARGNLITNFGEST